MATNPQFKVMQLAKDLGLKSKDIVDIFAEKGMDVKTQKTLDPQEFDLLFDTLTKSRQVDNIDDYLDGVTYIPSRLPKKAANAAKAQEALAAEKAAEKAADALAAEKAAAEKAAAERLAAEQAAQQAQATAEQVAQAPAEGEPAANAGQQEETNKRVRRRRRRRH